MQAPITMIRGFDLFQGLPDEEISALAKLASKTTIPAKKIIIEQDTTSDTAYFIVKGSVNVFRINENGEEISVSVLGEGDVVGEMALIDHEPRSAFVRTLTETTFLVLSQNDFSVLLKKFPSIAIHLLAELSNRIRQADLRVENLMTQNLESRTWNTLQVLKRYFDKGEITLTHEELAAIIGATRARVTKILDSLEKNNLITLSHKKITLS